MKLPAICYEELFLSFFWFELVGLYLRPFDAVWFASSGNRAFYYYFFFWGGGEGVERHSAVIDDVVN